MDNQRTDIWAGIMTLGTVGICILPNTNFLYWPALVLNVVGLGMLIYELKKAQYESTDQET